MKINNSNFFNKYKGDCEKFNNGPIHIPKIDPRNGVSGGKIVLMFINERPGRIGPGKSDLISFENQDQTAYRFKRLFDILGLDREKIFITNACIYYPIRSDYTDISPTTKEITFSAIILRDQIERVNSKIIVPMGNIALKTLKKFIPELKKIELKTSVAKVIQGDRLIFPLYHTSNRAAMTRSEENQIKDWKQLKKVISNII